MARRIITKIPPRIKVLRDRRGFVQRVVNPLGKGKAVIVQRVFGSSGFTILSEKGTGRKIGFSRTEGGAIKQALKKKKRIITFRD